MRRLSYVLVSTLCVWANDVRLYQLSFDVPNKKVSFKLRWSNAWRFAPDDPPGNWDAVWIFVKFRECNKYHDQWIHGLVSTTASDHTIPQGLEIVRSNGSATGVDPSPHNTGLMVRPANVGQFPNIPESNVDSLFIIQLVNSDTELDPSKEYDVRVFAIEMVFIPEGPYYLGTIHNGTRMNTTGDPFRCISTQPFAPYLVTKENNNYIAKATVTGGSNWDYNDNFPDGYKPFHVMKYEITQGQVAAFLNTLPEGWANSWYSLNGGNRALNILNTGTYPNRFIAPRPHRAAGRMRFWFLFRYLDWAALRPITEMEFEKICRGPAPVPEYPQNPDIFAWGDTVLIQSSIFSGPEDGTEFFINTGPNNHPSNAVYGNINFTGGDGGVGPARVGIHAANPNADNRTKRGASYYGVLDMSGNLWENTIHHAYHGTLNYSTSIGDGMLNNSGGYNVSGWLYDWGLTTYYWAPRGGAYDSPAHQLRISDRSATSAPWEWGGSFLHWGGDNVGARGARN